MAVSPLFCLVCLSVSVCLSVCLSVSVCVCLLCLATKGMSRVSEIDNLVMSGYLPECTDIQELADTSAAAHLLDSQNMDKHTDTQTHIQNNTQTDKQTSMQART